MTSPAAPTVDVTTLAQPLPPLKMVAGDRYPDLAADDGTKAAYVKHLLQHTSPIALTIARQAARNANYANGRCWLDWSNRRREWVDRPLEEGERRVTMNHIRPILRARTQRLLSAPIDFTIIPDSNALEQRDRAQLGVNFLQSRYRLSNMHQTVDTGLEFAYAGGVCALKSFWNPTIGPLQDAQLGVPELKLGPDGLPILGPDGQPVQETVPRPVVVEPGTGDIRPANEGEPAARYRLGDTDTCLRTVFNVRLNPEATGWRQADGLRYLLDVDEVPITVAKRKFPELAQKLTSQAGQNPTRIAEQSANTALVRNPQADPALGLSGTTQRDGEGTVLLVEYWELENPYFPTGRLIQMVGECVAYDGPFPDGFFPYEPLFDEPASGWAYGRPCINDMVDPADVINRQWTAIDNEMYESGIGQFISLDIPGVPNQLTREARAITKIPVRGALQGRGIGEIFQRLPHANVPPDRWRMIDKAESTLQDIGAYHEITRGQVPPGVDSGVAITQLREQENGQLQKAVRALKETLIGWARMQLKLARKYYQGVERWIPVERPDLGFMAEGVNGLELPDPDTVVIELENFKPRSEEAFNAQIESLMDKKVIPPAEGLRLLDLGRGVKGLYASQTRQYAKARQENLRMERGEASFEVIGEQEVEATVQDPMTGDTRTEETGVMEPVQRVCYVSPPDPDAAPSTDEMGNPVEPQPQLEPFILPTEDDHALHIQIHHELVLDLSKPAALRQLALAHVLEHRNELDKLAAQQAAVAPPPA